MSISEQIQPNTNFSDADALWLVSASLEERLNAVGADATPDTVLSALAYDNSADVREAIASHHNVTAETLALLVKDTSTDVRRAVALNAKTAAKTANALAYDVDTSVQFAAMTNPNVAADILKISLRLDEGLGVPVAANPATDPELLNRLSLSKNKEIRAGVAQNPSATTAALRGLARDSDEFVRYCVSRNLTTPEDVRVAVSLSL